MKSMGADELRATYLRFFTEREHKQLRSAPLVPQGDATLLFINAGMVPFKEIFTGRQTPPATRVVSSQKCVRAGGKHNDLENVGVTKRHHTFFEMLGNFSFGDYFKAEACAWAWQFLTDELELPKDRLWITIHDSDDEAQIIWEQKIGVPAERILRCGDKDNFWAMGDTGPCGPCTEIHWDRRPGESGDPLADDSRLLELWNLVFMQYERDAKGKLADLAAKSIDTGMGLERIAAVLAGEESNYHTDLFLPIIEGTAAQAGVTYERSDSTLDVALRVVADHARAATFLIADGVLPSNVGRGYVLRRIMRRAVRQGRVLGFESNFFAKACERVIDRMSGAYPDLRDAQGLILKVADNEEGAFRRTLDRGCGLLEESLAGLDTGQSLAGEMAFKLYDTFGFPIDLTRLIAAEHGFGVDEPGFKTSMEAQRERSRGELGLAGTGAVYHELHGQFGSSRFIGYAQPDNPGLEGSGELLALVVDDAQSGRVSAGSQAVAIVDSTPFYGESGGQIGDSGMLTWAAGSAKVLHTGKKEGLHTLEIEVLEGALTVGQRVDQKVDGEKRKTIRAHHSATHLLHSALQEVLGDHCKQAGSAVNADRLRFDFTHFSAVTGDELRGVETLVNGWVCANAEVSTIVMDLDEAKEAGATAMFGEKYAEEVRTVRIGEPSFELCGGIHVDRAGDIGFFRILSESALAAGVRRIEAVCGLAALASFHAESMRAQKTAALLKTTPAQLGERLTSMQQRLKEAEAELGTLRKQVAASQSTDLLAQVVEIAGIQTLAVALEGTKPDDLRELAESLAKQLPDSVIVLGGSAGPKAFLQVAVNGTVQGRVHAGKLVKVLARHIRGGGGGRPDMAQAGGAYPDGLALAIESLPEALSDILS
jgi:alanyl-tRNA synthetase